MRRKKKKGGRRHASPSAVLRPPAARSVGGVASGPSPLRPERADACGPQLQEIGEACSGRLLSGTRLGFSVDFLGSHSFPHLASRLSRLWSLPSLSRESFCGGGGGSPLRFARLRWVRSGLFRVALVCRLRWIQKIETLTGIDGVRRRCRKVLSRGERIETSAGG
jgi:hypothetical protein